MDTTFIYFLKDPENPKKGYVGKSDKPKTRFSQHLRHTKKGYCGHWIKALSTRSLRPILEILDEVPESEWPQWEVAYIEFFQEQGFILVNGTPGGDCGPIMSGENNPNFGRTGEKHPMFGRVGALHPIFGYKHLPEALVKMSAAKKGKTLSPAHCKNISLANRLKEKSSPETCAKRRNKKEGACSSFFGVSRDGRSGKWRARIHVNDKSKELGLFVDELDAAKAYDAAAKRYHGVHAKLNFPD